MGKYLLECCVDSVESAINAELGGADRLELCSNLIIGGTSPSVALFKSIREKVNIKIHVLLRPRFGDFLYTDNEFNIIKEEVKIFRKLGADGVVIGCLNKDGNLDIEKMRELVNEAGNMNVVLHRAFDMTKDPFKTLEEAKVLGVSTILTSGQKNTALEGMRLLKQLVEKAGEDIEILVGSGINANVIERFIKETKVVAYHMSGKINLDSKMEYRKEGVSMGLPMMSEYEVMETSVDKIKEAKDIIKNNQNIIK